GPPQRRHRASRVWTARSAGGIQERILRTLRRSHGPYRGGYAPFSFSSSTRRRKETGGADGKEAPAFRVRHVTAEQQWRRRRAPPGQTRRMEGRQKRSLSVW